LQNYNNSSVKKFLRRPLDVGEYLRDLQVIISSEEIGLYDLITDHLLLICFSTDCQSCLVTLEALYEFTEKNQNYNIVMLVHANEDERVVINKTFAKIVSKVLFVEKSVITKRLQIRELPRGYCLNKLGQVLAQNNCFDQYWFGELVKPLKHLMDKKKEVIV